MLGCVVGRLGGAPELAEWPRPGRLPGQALVKVSVAALNPIDLLISAGKHPAGVPPVPHVPGIEAVGSTVESDHHAAGMIPTLHLIVKVCIPDHRRIRGTGQHRLDLPP